jgi:hypothetical protein
VFGKRDRVDLPHSGLSQLALCVSSLKTNVVCVCVCVWGGGAVQFAHASPIKPSNA